MTPLAHRIVKELTLPLAKRTFNDQCGLLGRMDDIHCFDATEVIEIAKDFSDAMARHGDWLSQTAFLPAPRTWIEFIEDGQRMGILLTCRDDYAFAKCAFVDRSMDTGIVLCLGSEASHNDYEHRNEYRHLYRVILAILAIINSPRVIGRQQHMPHRGLERRLAKAKGLVGKFPLHAWTELKLSVSDIGKRADGTTHEAHYTGEKCLHFCRAHLRVKNGRLERVSAHWRGNPALGIKRSRYRLAA